MADSPSAPLTSHLSTGQLATLACQLEVSAPKPGNVHRGADFENLTFQDFLSSAVAIAPAMQNAVDQTLGTTILQAVQATRQLVDTNTNLGMILLLAPLCSVPREQSLETGLEDVLNKLTANDASKVYQAIQLAEPGSLGDSSEMDIREKPPADLLAAMQLAANRDLVARQYVNKFETVFLAADWLTDSNLECLSTSQKIIHTHVKLMSQFPDSLIARKSGNETAANSAALAKRVIDTGSPFCEEYQYHLSSLDFWLRSDNNRRNPGTTADLVTAAVFVALRNNRINPPFH